MRFSIYKGDRPSVGATNLAAALDATVLRPTGSTYRGRPNNLLINWGSYSAEARRLWGLAAVKLNNPEAIRGASDKRAALSRLSDQRLPCVPFWGGNSISEVYQYVLNGGRAYARTVLSGHSGDGIVLIINENDSQIDALRGAGVDHYVIGEGDARSFGSRFGSCQLFTQGITGHRHEWRVHVFNGQAILSQLKMRRSGFQEIGGYTSLVRNHGAGYVYGVNYPREDHPELAQVEQVAVDAVTALGLDFGAVDLIQKKQHGREIYVLEVNTAPGLEEGGSSLQAYATAIREYAAQVEQRGAA